MIKVTKTATVPKSLNSIITQKRRNEIINSGLFPTKTTIKGNTNFTSDNVSTYESRFKADDITNELKDNVYNCKCAYCEQKIEQTHVEHYRPKSVYYWLAYSWDNLLSCCPYCNEYKSANFLVNSRATINSLDISTSDIHNLRNDYDRLESPELINPEKENVVKDFIFNKLGYISSTNTRVQYTIQTCKLDRTWLNERRRELYDNFIERVNFRKSEIMNGNKDAIVKLKGLIEDFIDDSKSPKMEYIAFRKYIVRNLLNE